MCFYGLILFTSVTKVRCMRKKDEQMMRTKISRLPGLRNSFGNKSLIEAIKHSTVTNWGQNKISKQLHDFVPAMHLLVLQQNNIHLCQH